MTDDPSDVPLLPTGAGWDDLVAAGAVDAATPATLARARAVVDEAVEGERTGGAANDAERRTSRRRVAVSILAAAAGVAVAFGVYLSRGQGPSADVPLPAVAATHPSGPVGSFTAASCVEEYDVTSLAHRDFAFDGTVMTIEDAQQSDPDLGYSAVTFQVNEWFRGGTGHTVTVAMSPPGDEAGGSAGTDLTAEWSPFFGEGTRLLVSGEPRWGGRPLDEALAWACGFTRYYDPTTAADWRQVFTD